MGGGVSQKKAFINLIKPLLTGWPIPPLAPSTATAEFCDADDEKSLLALRRGAAVRRAVRPIMAREVGGSLGAVTLVVSVKFKTRLGLLGQTGFSRALPNPSGAGH